MDTDQPQRKRSKPTTSTLDRLPPNSPEAEQSVLSCLFQDPQGNIGQCVERLRGAGEAFYDLRHRTIYETMLELWGDGDGIDLVTIQDRLKAWGNLDQVGGITYLSELLDAAPSAANLSYYLDIVDEKYLLRRMISVCVDSVSRLYDFEGDVEKSLDEIERDILRVSESRVRTDTPDVKALVRQAINEIEVSQSRNGEPTGLRTGFVDYDKMTMGLQPGEMVVIAARPSMGKTSLAMNIAEYVALDSKLPVGIFSLEMKAAALIKRMICSRARVNASNVRDGFLAERDYPKITGAAGKIATAPIYIDDAGGLSVLQVRAKARRMYQQYGIKLCVIDYLQLMNAIGGKRKFESRQQEVSDISHGVKELAKELNIPVLVLSQLNRNLERENSRKPRLSDLRESGSIEQDADVVGFLYKTRNGDDDDDGEYSSEAVPINLLIAKSRNGPTGEVPLTFLKPYTRFESAAKVSDEDMPQDNQREFAP